jgi:hypothetical protein
MLDKKHHRNLKRFPWFRLICLKILGEFKDSIELAEHEAIELAEVLTKLVQEQRG